MVDYYPNKSEDELLVLLNALQKRQINGTITEVSAAGVRTVRDLKDAGNARIEVEIRRVMFSLHVRAPDEYDNPYASRIRRTRTRYTFS
jgi:hypothetical protein